MTLRLPEIFSKSVATRLRQVGTFLAFLLILFSLLILAAPTILSSQFAQNRLKATLSTTLRGPVNWSRLQLSWSHGLQLRDLTIGPAKGALRQARIGAIDCRPGFGFGAEAGDSFGFDLFLHLHELQVVLAPPEPTTPSPVAVPPEERPDPLTALAQALDRFATLSFPLPIDLRIDVAIDPISLSYLDPASGRSLLLEEGSLQLLIPSLERAPLSFSLEGKIQVDEHRLGALHLATQISGLVAPSGRIVPATAFLSTVGEFPGIRVKAEGRLDQEQGLNSELRLDLPALQVVAAPFLPADLSPLGGTLLATLHAQLDQEENLALSCTLIGDKIQAAEVGPVNFDLGQQIELDQRRQIVTLGGGVLTIPQLLEARWEASVAQPTSLKRQVSARLQELDLNLDQALILAAPLLPPGLPQLPGGRLQLRDLDLQLHGAEGDGELRLARAEVVLPELHLVQPEAELSGVGIELVVTDLATPLTAYFPDSLATTLEWKVAGLQLRGAQPLALQGLDSAGTLAITDVCKEEGKGGLSGKGSFNHQLYLKSAEVPALARISDLANDLHLSFALLAGGGIKMESMQLTTTIAAVTATVAGKKLLPLPISQNLQIDDLELLSGESLPRIKNIAFSLSSPQLLTLTSTASLATERLLTLNLRTRIELPRLMEVAGPLLPKGLTASGTISKEVQLVATLPDQPLPGGQQPLRSAQSALALLKEVSGSVQLDGVEAHLPLTNGTLHLSAIKTPQALRLQSRRNGEEIDLSGAIDFDLRAGSVFNGKTLPVGPGQITLRGEVRDWDRVFVAETIKVAALGIAQRSELTITGLTTLLDETLPPPPATLLQRLDATLFSEIDLNLRPESLSLLPELTMSGSTFAGTRIDLRAGQSLRLHAYADVKDLDLSLAQGPQLHGLQAHFNLDRSLKIRSAATSQGRFLPLSTLLVQPLPLALPPPLAGEKRRLHDDLRGSSSKERSLRIADLTLPLAPLPLTIQSLEGEILTGQEEAGMNFLQMELLGGTLRGRALIDLRPIVPVVSAEALFTNLDLDRLGRDSSHLQSAAAASSISGEGRITLPLLTEERALLEGLTLSGHLRSIGAQSFDRALARLDPYERNEAIMAQRKLLRLGQLQGVEVQVADGALSLTGAVSSRGVKIALPKIERLRLADLSLHQELAPALTAISAARNALEFVRADTIQLDAQGKISLRKEEK